MTYFFVPGIPAPQGSKRHLGNGILVPHHPVDQPTTWDEQISGHADHGCDACDARKGER